MLQTEPSLIRYCAKLKKKSDYRVMLLTCSVCWMILKLPADFVSRRLLATHPSLPVLHLQKTEVAELFLAPISFFLDEQHEHIKQQERSGKFLNSYFYHYQNHIIWGATAAILRSFLHGVRDAVKSFPHTKTL